MPLRNITQNAWIPPLNITRRVRGVLLECHSKWCLRTTLHMPQVPLWTLNTTRSARNFSWSATPSTWNSCRLSFKLFKSELTWNATSLFLEWTQTRITEIGSQNVKTLSWKLHSCTAGVRAQLICPAFSTFRIYFTFHFFQWKVAGNKIYLVDSWMNFNLLRFYRHNLRNIYDQVLCE